MKLGALTTKLGQRRDLASLPEAQAEPWRISKLRKLGLRYFMDAGDGLEALMLEAVKEAVETAALDPLGYDLVLYATSSFDQRRDSRLMSTVLRHCGLFNARPIGVFHGFCTNFTYSLEVLQGLTGPQWQGQALLIFADSYNDHDSRILRHEATVGSDGVACAVVSDKLGAGYYVGPICHHYDVRAAEHLQEEDVVSYVRAYTEGVRRSTGAALQASSTEHDSCTWMVTANFNRTVLKNVSVSSGISPERIYDRNLSEVGHCNSADQVISLQQILESDIEHGAKVLVSGPADTVWGAVVMTVAKDQNDQVENVAV